MQQNNMIYSEQLPQTNNENIKLNEIPVEDNTNDMVVSIALFILGFFTVIIWLVGYLLFKNSKNQTAKLFAILSGVFFAISVIFTIISFLIAIVSIILIFVLFGAIFIFFFIIALISGGK
eukprot:EC821430.1.p1 GENE.EC821430.1~~EC821430.1.p1  ORF type:complete len:120 (+),score=43.41 EC821430.1:28-387(+)